MRRLLVIVFVAAAATLQSSQPAAIVIVWRKVTTRATNDQFPNWVGYMKPVFDATSGSTLWYTSRSTSSIIYSTDVFSYKAVTQMWTRLGGTGSAQQTCGDGTTATDTNGNPVLPWPSDRHPIEQLAIDTTRRRLYLQGGVCRNITPNDTWFYALNADPRLNRWSKVTTANTPSVQVSGSMEYSPADDVIVLHGTSSSNFPKTWVLCPTSSGASLTASQRAAGCVTPNEWAETYAPNTVDPPQSYFSSLVHVPKSGKMLHFGHYAPNGEVWAYDIARRRWENLNPTGRPSEPDTFGSPERLVAYVSSGLLAGKVFYHQTSHNSETSLAADWLYDPATNSWKSLPAIGFGPQKLANLAFDPSVGVSGTIVAFSYDGGMWHGTIQEGGGISVPNARLIPRVIW